ncbi:hypothetical protein DSO57_1026589 [Entomophthora muscae]|uniref:Uncharacterized protein n=1 Tax=Entomophthora muscae TaxID=34485 RepID=A0ACC2S415_9FUNG|nr:hypothetical protein DSO57_1026589 [Entomophthora muscae]
MLMMLAHVRQRLDNNRYTIPTHECPMITIQRPAKHPRPTNCQASPPATSSAHQRRGVTVGSIMPGTEGQKTCIKIDQVNGFKPNSQSKMDHSCASMPAETSSPL